MSDQPTGVERVSLDGDLAPQRITVTLILKVRAELRYLADTTGLNITDLVNRAVSLYTLVVNHNRAGYELVFRHRETGHERVVEIL